MVPFVVAICRIVKNRFSNRIFRKKRPIEGDNSAIVNGKLAIIRREEIFLSSFFLLHDHEMEENKRSEEETMDKKQRTKMKKNPALVLLIVGKHK